MENQNGKPEAPAKTQTQVPRVARCLVCSNEWTARDGSKKKPSRCPECMERNVKWRDECTPEELKTRKEESQEKHEEPNANAGIPEPKEMEKEPEPPKQETERKPEAKQEELENIGAGIGKIPPAAIILLLGIIAAVGLIVIFFRNRKRKIKQINPVTPEQTKAEQENRELISRVRNLNAGGY